jgi:glycosyltransferase involved in cell wall biosynthesis
MWLALLALPWRPWLIRETLDGEPTRQDSDLSDVTALIPARDEADTLPLTIRALARQGDGLHIVVVDDQSQDGTAELVSDVGPTRIRVVSGTPLPAGWKGKLWALEQGRRQVGTRLILLLDADIELRPGIMAALRAKLQRDKLQFVSLMALLRTESLWEKLLMPTLKFYRLSPAWALAMPLIGTLYLGMTWSSAYRWWIGRGYAWKGRTYSKNLDSEASR